MGVEKFIVFEGIDGSGTTTVSQKIVERLNTEHHSKAVWTSEPSSGAVGRLIRELLKLSNPDIHTLALLFAADRLDHFRNFILPNIISGNLVICDRYRMSALAYQAPSVGLDWVQHIDAVPDPCLTVLLDVPVNVSLERIGHRNTTKEYFERADKLEVIRSNYLKLYGLGNSNYKGEIHKIDASAPIEDVIEESWGIVLPHL